MTYNYNNSLRLNTDCQLTPIAEKTMAKLSSWSSRTLLDWPCFTRPPCLQIWAAIWIRHVHTEHWTMVLHKKIRSGITCSGVKAENGLDKHLLYTEEETQGKCNTCTYSTPCANQELSDHARTSLWGRPAAEKMGIFCPLAILFIMSMADIPVWIISSG